MQLEGLDHVVLRSHEPTALEAFYIDVLGCQVERRLDIGLVQLRAGASLIDIVDAASELGQQPAANGQLKDRLDHFCLRVNNFSADDIEAYLRAQGHSGRGANRVYGANGYGPSIYLQDPDGNTIELKGPSTDADLARKIYQAAKLDGEFTLRSGATSDTYFDKYRFEAEPTLLSAIATALTMHIPPGAQVLAGLEMGGIPIVTMMSQTSRLPCAFIRKQAKTYGTAQYAEGAPLGGRTVVLVEDVVSSGGALLDAAQKLQADGIQVQHALCVIDRQSGGEQALADIGIELRALYRMQELIAAAA